MHVGTVRRSGVAIGIRSELAPSSYYPARWMAVSPAHSFTRRRVGRQRARRCGLGRAAAAPGERVGTRTGASPRTRAPARAPGDPEGSLAGISSAIARASSVEARTPGECGRRSRRLMSQLFMTPPSVSGSRWTQMKAFHRPARENRLILLTPARTPRPRSRTPPYQDPPERTSSVPRRARARPAAHG